jgi:hypothetical protein
MKNMKRASRRHKKHVKFIKRVKKWVCGLSAEYQAKEIEIALTGKGYYFLKTTGNPCNCYMCTYLKYKRVPNNKIIRDALKE